MPTPFEGQAIDRALSRAVLCRVLATALSPPDVEELKALFSATGCCAAGAAARSLEGDRPGRLTRAVLELTGSSLPPSSSLARVHQGLFGHTLRGQVCPYECEYGQGAPLQQAQQLADLAGTYRAFGLAVRAGDRADHVVCELEFLGFLSRKEALALERGDGELSTTTRKAVKRFLGRHLGRFGRAFARALSEAAPSGFYRDSAEVMEAFLGVECARLGIPAGPAMLELCAIEPDPAPMACGGEDRLVQIGGR